MSNDFPCEIEEIKHEENSNFLDIVNYYNWYKKKRKSKKIKFPKA